MSETACLDGMCQQDDCPACAPKVSYAIGVDPGKPGEDKTIITVHDKEYEQMVFSFTTGDVNG